MLLNYGQKNQVSFANEYEYYCALGFLAMKIMQNCIGNTTKIKGHGVVKKNTPFSSTTNFSKL